VSEIAASPLYMEVELAPGAEFVQAVPEGHTALAYIFEGEAYFAGTLVSAARLVVFNEGDRVLVKADHAPARFMLFAGAPFREPIAPYGPFVMNTREEILQALDELRNGTFIQPGGG
jgi:redox-sensitive bicupin YhaK (pirin superfamily)